MSGKGRDRWRVVVRGVRLESILGVLPQERQAPTQVVVDAAVWVDAGLSARTDDLADTLDYVEMVRLMEQVAAASSDHLLEKFAVRLAEAVFARWERACRVRLRIRKPGVLENGDPAVECDLRRQ